jgi:hypothetical protein
MLEESKRLSARQSTPFSLSPLCAISSVRLAVSPPLTPFDLRLRTFYRAAVPTHVHLVSPSSSPPPPFCVISSPLSARLSASFAFRSPTSKALPRRRADLHSPRFPSFCPSSLLLVRSCRPPLFAHFPISTAFRSSTSDALPCRRADPRSP